MGWVSVTMLTIAVHMPGEWGLWSWWICHHTHHSWAPLQLCQLWVKHSSCLLPQHCHWCAQHLQPRQVHPHHLCYQGNYQSWQHVSIISAQTSVAAPSHQELKLSTSFADWVRNDIQCASFQVRWYWWGGSRCSFPGLWPHLRTLCKNSIMKLYLDISWASHVCNIKYSLLDYEGSAQSDVVYSSGTYIT